MVLPLNEIQNRKGEKNKFWSLGVEGELMNSVVDLVFVMSIGRINLLGS